MLYFSTTANVWFRVHQVIQLTMTMWGSRLTPTTTMTFNDPSIAIGRLRPSSALHQNLMALGAHAGQSLCQMKVSKEWMTWPCCEAGAFWRDRWVRRFSWNLVNKGRQMDGGTSTSYLLSISDNISTILDLVLHWLGWLLTNMTHTIRTYILCLGYPDLVLISRHISTNLPTGQFYFHLRN